MVIRETTWADLLEEARELVGWTQVQVAERFRQIADDPDRKSVV